MWRSLSEAWPAEKEPVLLLMPDKFVPLVGYWKTYSLGRYWVVPGIGEAWGEPEWWCAVPRPYPVPAVERFNSLRSVGGRG
jgi:hypothetical protein